jgi:DNA-binding NarL/FixJ family response regulator
VRILICDLHGLFSQSLAVTLRRSGHEVRVTAKSVGAVALAAEGPADLCLLDLRTVRSPQSAVQDVLTLRRLMPMATILLIDDSTSGPSQSRALLGLTNGVLSRSASLLALHRLISVTAESVSLRDDEVGARRDLRFARAAPVSGSRATPP